MSLKKKTFILSIFIIIIIQILLYINNTQKTSFRYFIWNLNEISIGKLISISFFSGLIVSSILNNQININLNKNNINDNKKYEDYDDLNNEKNNSTKVEMPPQRDIRDTQPTVSVNYRVIKDNGNINSRNDDTSYDNQKDNNDWNNNDTDW